MSIRGALARMVAMFGAYDTTPEGSRGSRVKDTADESIHEQAKAKAQAKRDRKAARRRQEAGEP